MDCTWGSGWGWKFGFQRQSLLSGGPRTADLELELIGFFEELGPISSFGAPNQPVGYSVIVPSLQMRR